MATRLCPSAAAWHITVFRCKFLLYLRIPGQASFGRSRLWNISPAAEACDWHELTSASGGHRGASRPASWSACATPVLFRKSVQVIEFAAGQVCHTSNCAASAQTPSYSGHISQSLTQGGSAQRLCACLRMLSSSWLSIGREMFCNSARHSCGVYFVVCQFA